MKPVHATLEINIVDVVQTSEWKKSDKHKLKSIQNETEKLL